MLTIEQLKQVHSTYAKHVSTWDYLARSYAGGTEYRMAGYLRKYLNEDQAPGGNQYAQRLIANALDNHVQTVVNVYRSYIFRTVPTRTLGLMGEFYGAEDFIDDCDLDETELDDFQRSVSDTLSIYGTAWICVDRPAYQAKTLAEEQALGIRPYASMYTPMQVLDWNYERDVTGRSVLTYVKIREASYDKYDVIRVWTPEVIYEYEVERDEKAVTVRSSGDINTQPVSSVANLNYTRIIKRSEYINPIGIVPVFCAYNGRKVLPGYAVSDIEDVADHQRMIYNLTSELDQSIRISSHPSLVKTATTIAAAGAGAIITMDDSLPGDMKPYLLQASGATIASILAAIEYHKTAIDRLTHLSAIRGEKTQSGVATEADFLVLNSRLADKAARLEQVEKKMWNLFFNWQGTEKSEDFEISYETSFSLRDKQRDLDQLAQGLGLVDNPLYRQAAQQAIVGITLEDDEVIEVIQQSIVVTQDPDGVGRGLMLPGETQPSLGEEPEQQIMPLAAMITAGYSTAEILAMHPEVDVETIDELRHAI
jgi:hypothetical protein